MSRAGAPFCPQIFASGSSPRRQASRQPGKIRVHENRADDERHVPTDCDCAHALGANLCLKKPLYFRQLVSLVKDVIDRLQREGSEVLDLDAEAA